MPRIDQTTFYANALKKHGATARGVAWNDEKRQKRRFDALLKQVPDLASCTIVDAGCGFGDLFLYMQHIGRLPKTYIGVDMMAPMVEEAQKRTGRRILQRDLLTDPLPEADWYLASGSFNLLTRFETLLAVKRCFDAAQKGIVFNLLKGRDKSDTYNYWLPREIKKACAGLGRITVYEGYLEGDFTVKIEA
ncbi:class I SAM-dependent methyltransferase [Hydrogenimonas sp. SS33]|uniref:class I SAM-dependent methyltransferase n=1 Tax=Hydrogenimonas leucolamina TaxID=2954236 RepID=UPI00336BBC52